jgi:predicted Na+-dependent transporter
MTRLFKLSKPDQTTVVIETILQNGAMGFVVGAIIFDKVEYIMPVAAYALLQYVFILIYFSYQNIKRTE